MTDRLMLLDTAALYFRAFYGVPDTVHAPDGRPVNAARGLLDIITRLVSSYQPSHLVACWDNDWRPQWRVDLIPSYKTHRVAEVVAAGPDVEEVPDPLEVQIPVIREALQALGIVIVGADEHEADDVIGTLASTATMPVDVVTGDRDLFQLVDDSREVRVIYTARGMSNLELVTNQVVFTKYGVHANQYADFATLRGDSSDGLPGVPGVGDKTAATLLSAHQNLGGIVQAAQRGEGMTARIAAKVLAAADYLEVAPTVVAVVRDLPLPEVNSRLQPATDVSRQTIATVTERWGLGSSMQRAAAAIEAAAG